VPPQATLASTSSLVGAKWVKHRVIPGDRVAAIAKRYGVDASDVRRWNKLNEKSILQVGKELRIHTRVEPPVIERVRYRVKRGDSWSRIAQKHDVSVRRLRRQWNPKIKGLQPGQKLVVWVEREAGSEKARGTDADEGGKALPQVAVSKVAESVGRPGRGRIRRAIQLPPNPALYTIRNPAHSWASSHTITHLQKAVADFRERTGFEREIVIADISRKGGGRFRPHHSHTSGRDVDIRLPLAEGVEAGKVPWGPNEVDWDATWEFVRSIAATGQVQYVFLARPRQRLLYRAAKRSGASKEELEQLVQFPRYARTAMVRHSRGHVKHLHVRFTCGESETRCRD
jgi:LysM repeat protein